MMTIGLDDRVYWIASFAYPSTQSVAATQAFNAYPSIGNKLMDVFVTHQKSLKATN
jgi:hypothetical protein